MPCGHINLYVAVVSIALLMLLLLSCPPLMPLLCVEDVANLMPNSGGCLASWPGFQFYAQKVRQRGRAACLACSTLHNCRCSVAF